MVVLCCILLECLAQDLYYRKAPLQIIRPLQPYGEALAEPGAKFIAV